MHYSLVDWSQPSLWAGYFERAQRILGTHLVRLDTNDPVRRSVPRDAFNEFGEYIVDIEDTESSRWTFGKFKQSNVLLTIEYYKDNHPFCSSLSWDFHERFFKRDTALDTIRRLFAFGNQYLGPYWSYSDEIEFIRMKKTFSRRAVDLERELVGVFWLTYFNESYCNFFGAEKMRSIGGQHEEYGGMTFDLGESPSQVTPRARQELEEAIGKMSFVDPTRDIEKPKGKYALTYDQLSTIRR